MPIAPEINKRFSESLRSKLKYLFLFGALFGLVIPVVLNVIVAGAGNGVWAVWPSLLSQAYQYSFIIGFAGMMALGLLCLVAAEVVDHTFTKRDWRAIAAAMSVYAAGAMLHLLSLTLEHYFGVHGSERWLDISGHTLEILGWCATAIVLIRLPGTRQRLADNFFQLLFIGAVFFLLSHLLLAFIHLSHLMGGEALVPFIWLRAINLYFIVGSLSFILIGFFARLAPEMLGWRPMSDGRLRWISRAALGSFFLMAIGYPLFHVSLSQPGAFLYGIGAFFYLVTIVLFLQSIDLRYVRLPSSERRSQVIYLYASLVWLLIAAGMLVIIAVWEIFHVAAVPDFMQNALFFAFFGGFGLLSLLGIYTYIINSIEGLYTRWEGVSNLAFVIMGWALLLRVLIVPLMIMVNWPGFVTFRWVTDVVLFIGFALALGEMTIALLVSERRRGRRRSS